MDQVAFDREVFHSGMSFSVGDGIRVQCWMDEWLGVGPPLCLSFPRFFRVVANKLSYVKECYVREEDFVSWRVLYESEVSEYESLLSLPFNVFICRFEVDSHIWKPSPSGVSI